MGIFPRRNATTTLKSFKPMADYLSQRLGRKVETMTTNDFTTFWSNVAAQKYDIVHYNQYHYIKSKKELGHKAILKNQEFGSSTLKSVIFVRKDSGIKTLQDLKGKRIIFGGDTKAMISYVVPTALLRRAGLKTGDYIEKFSKNPPNTLLSVYFGQADAACTGNVIFNAPTVKDTIDISQINVLAESEPLAHIVWAVNNTVSLELETKIKTILLELNDSEEGKKILKRAKMTGLRKVSDNEYDIHRQYLQEVFGDNY